MIERDKRKFPVKFRFGTISEYAYRKRMLGRLHRIGRTKMPYRGKVDSKGLVKIMKEIEYGRAMEYLNGDKKRKLMCVLGKSGTGKTLGTLHLKNKLGANVICSFTSRKPRRTEVEGREHHFIDIMPADEDVLAKSKIGDIWYYALTCQVWGDCTVYAVDEKGLQYIRENHSDKFDIYTVWIERSLELRRQDGVTEERTCRDSARVYLPMDSFDYIVKNDGLKSPFFKQLEKIYNEIKNK